MILSSHATNHTVIFHQSLIMSSQQSPSFDTPIHSEANLMKIDKQALVQSIVSHTFMGSDTSGPVFLPCLQVLRKTPYSKLLGNNTHNQR